MVDALTAVLRLAARIAGTRRATLTIARPGDAPLCLAVGSGRVPAALCRACLAIDGVAAKELVAAGPALRGSPVLDDEALGFVLTVPVVDPDGIPIGGICVADEEARPAGASCDLRASLDELARIAGALAARGRRHDGTEATAPVPAAADLDPVTGLPNRQHARARLRRHLAERAAERHVAVHIVGIDHFHEINEDHGHCGGDLVLREIARRLRRSVRGGDVVGRLGGDEFGVVQPDIADASAAHALASRLVEIIRAPILLGDRLVRTTASVGIAVAPDDGADTDLVPANANIAMRRAKAEGGDRACPFDALADPATRRRRERRRALAAAIDDEALEVRFQPKVELATNRLIGAEALVRWFTTAEGEITPDEFIPLAEETGLVIPLGRSVLTRACRAAASWPDGRAVAVNLSPVQLERDDVVATVEHALAASGLDPHRLELEITENVLMHDVAHATAVLRRLRELGVKLALDDFGTGYSSLNMVWRLPLDTLKLDRAFVHALDVDPRTVDIVAGILAMARRLDLDTVAEGVETSRQREILRDLGCRLGQGFLFGPARAELDCAEPLSLPRARA